jgi:hypothetical protein
MRGRLVTQLCLPDGTLVGYAGLVEEAVPALELSAELAQQP